MAVSPDGADIVYLAIAEGIPRLFLKKAGRFETNELAGTEDARAPFFSPDGRWIGFVNQQTREIYKVLVDGGKPLKITSFNGGLGSATWAPDNTIIFRDDGVFKRIPESGGEPTILLKTKRAGEQPQFPHMLPDGETMLFTVVPSDGALNSHRLAIYRFGDDDYRVILDEEGYNGAYSSTGHILYGRSDRLMGVPFDLKTLAVTGVPAPVLDNVQTNSQTGSMSYALSKEGTIIYVPGTGADSDLSVFNVDLSGKTTDFLDLKKRFRLARYSPDGKYVGFVINEENNSNIWMYRIEGDILNQLTFYKRWASTGFEWSPDSKTIAYATTAEDSSNSIYLRKIDGTGTAKKIYTSPLKTTLYVEDWSPDGNMLVLQQIGEFTRSDLFVYSFRDNSIRPYLVTPAHEWEPNFSPNGNWIVYVSSESGGSREVYVRPYPESSGGMWKISSGGGDRALWSPDGKKIYYRSFNRSRNEMYSVDVTSGDVFSKGNPKRIFKGDYFFSGGRRFDIHPDGDRFIMLQNFHVNQQAQKIFVIQNFSEELKRLVPGGKP